METYKSEINDLSKHLEQVILLATGGFGTGDAGQVKRMKAVLHLRGLGRKSFLLMNRIAEEVEPEGKPEPISKGEGYTDANGRFMPYVG